VTRERSPADGRRQTIRLTEQGGAAFALLDARSADQVRRLLERLGEDDQRRLVGAMATIRELLDGPPRPQAYILRPLRAGDLGWVVQRHGVFYAEEYGWDDSFEALVARIVADYADHREPVGCVFCMKKSQRTAQLRLLLVEPSARGLGIGTRLVEGPALVPFAVEARRT
jgi:GNAT superfamily N-acetyltransferase